MFQPEKNKQKINLTESYPNTPGEYWIVIILFFITGLLFIESVKLPGIFQGYTHRMGTMPQLMTGIVLLLLFLILIQMIKNRYRQGTVRETLLHLFSKEVIILIFAVSTYGYLLKYLHFRITTFFFLWGCMYFFDPKRPLLKLFISIVVLILINFIFSTIFKVLLP
jgi:hypothetical protein